MPGDGASLLFCPDAHFSRLAVAGLLGADQKLIMSAVDTMALEKRVSRAEALRKAMLTMTDGSPAKARPSYWAPFLVAGEGAATAAAQ